MTRALAALTGDIEQVPSSVSAIKVDGQRAYDLARAGETVTLAARPVTVGRLDVTGLRRPTPDLVDVDVDVECTSGTYVRALARDAGAALGVGAHLTALRRTRVGPFELSRALTLEQLAERPDPITLPLPTALGLTMPVRSITALEADELTYGRALAPAGLVGTYGVVDPAGRAVALLERGRRAGPAGPRLHRPRLRAPALGPAAGATAAGTPAARCPRHARRSPPVGFPNVQRWDGLDDIPDGYGPCVVTIGVFDCVHRGHSRVGLPRGCTRRAAAGCRAW